MKLSSLLLVSTLIGLSITPGFSQNHKKIDSLLLVLKNSKEDTFKVNTLNSISFEFRYTNTDTSAYFANQALALASKLSFQMGIADSKVRMSMYCATSGKYYEGVRYGEEASAIYNKLLSSIPAADMEKHLKKIASCYNVIAHNYLNQGNYPGGLKYSFLSLKIREQIGSKKGIADCEFNIGNAYYGQQEYIEAINHYTVSLELYKELGDKADIASTYSAIGFMYFEQNLYPEALTYYTTALKLAKEAEDKITLADIYSNLGVINDRLGNYIQALQYNFTALHLFEEIGNNEQIAFIYNSISMVYLKQKIYNDASVYLNKALSFAKEIGKLEYIKLSYQNMATLDSSLGNYKQALRHYKMYIIFRDSLVNDANTKKIVQQQMQYEFDKKEDSTKAAQEIKDALTKVKITNQKLTRDLSLMGTLAVVFLSVYGFYRYRRKKKLQGQQDLMKERLRISRELHDEVGATLSGIAMYSHLTKEQIKNADTVEVEKSLDIMQQSAGEMVNKLNDIVWLVNPEQDTLQKLIERLEEYARDMASIKNMEVNVHIPDNIATISLPIESRRNIYMFCKEAINNAVKYSNATLLELTIKEVKGKMEFTVSDNGKGFDAVMVRRGNGLVNMQQRADEIGAKLLIQSQHEGGAQISLQCKIT